MAHLSEAVIKSCRCTATEVELDCREWFRTGSDRDGGRKKRAERRQSTANNEL